MSRKISKKEVSKHNTDEDCWVIINKKVYNITRYLNEHPGGKIVFKLGKGKDISKRYNSINYTWEQHKIAANMMLETLYIGDLEEEKSSGLFSCLS